MYINILNIFYHINIIFARLYKKESIVYNYFLINGKTSFKIPVEKIGNTSIGLFVEMIIYAQ
jgi:hypothetical protein